MYAYVHTYMHACMHAYIHMQCYLVCVCLHIWEFPKKTAANVDPHSGALIVRTTLKDSQTFQGGQYRLTKEYTISVLEIPLPLHGIILKLSHRSIYI